jgi:hypothetical protein
VFIHHLWKQLQRQRGTAAPAGFMRIPVHTAKRQVPLAALALVEHPPPAAMQSNPVVAQLALPLRSRGLACCSPPSLDAGWWTLASVGTPSSRGCSGSSASPCAAATRPWVGPPCTPSLKHLAEPCCAASLVPRLRWSGVGRGYLLDGRLGCPVWVCPGSVWCGCVSCSSRSFAFGLGLFAFRRPCC